MDILTPAGQKTLADEARAQEIFENNFPKYRYIHTPKKRPADVDAIMVRDSEVMAVIETKCRYDVDLNEFNIRYRATWLVTFEKILKGQQISNALRVPLVGFLYLKRSDVLLMETISRDGHFLPKIVIEDTMTQATINGGSVVRTNAYIDMSNSRVLRW